MDKVNINLITVGDRYRKDLGDIDALANSINVLGLLQPIGIDSNYALIFGERRLRACQQLGLDTIGARIIHVDNLAAEHDENEIRKSFTISERVAIAKARQDALGDRRGVNQHTKELVPNSAQAEPGTKTRDIAAGEAGFKRTNYAEASKVVEAGDADIVQLMDDEQVSVSFAAALVDEDEETRHEIVEKIQAGTKPTDAKRQTIATLHTGDEESYTPGIYIESARKVMGTIDMDPASNTMAQETVKAGTFYTVDDDGLTKDWAGNVWMNPPYTARVINKFIEKFVEDFSAGEISQGLILTNNNTDTSWFHIGASYASAICFTAGRINFLKRDGSKSSPTNGQLFFYFGNNVAAFKDEFSSHGLVMVKA